MRSLTPLLSLLSLMFLLQAPGHAASATPEGAAEAFYRWVLTNNAGGLPSAAQRRELARILTADFVKRLEAAGAAEAKSVADTPRDMKPDIWEGSLFVGSYEGATEVWYGASRPAKADVIIDANLLYIEEQQAKGSRNRVFAWQDSVRLRKTRAGWLVADVLRGETGNTAHPKESLTKLLNEYIKAHRAAP